MNYIVLGVILIFSIGVLLIIWNKNQSKKYKKLINIRNSIARDLHDDVGATLSSISFYTDAAKQRISQNKPDEALAILEEMGESARNTIENMSDIVWMVNPKNDSFENLFQKIEDYARKMASSNAIEVEYINTIDHLSKIDLIKRRDIYLICKESINNAVKYAQASKLLVQLSKEQQQFVVLVKDNGTGFDTELVKKGSGLLNLQVRANALGAHISINSTPTIGTEIKLVVPLHLLNT